MSETSIITRARRINLCKLTSGAISSIPPITHMAFGTGGVDKDGEPIVPSETQTALKNEIKRYPIESVTYPVETTARYVAVIPKGELSGEKISEAALVDSSGTLYTIKNMYVKQKDKDTSFSFTFDDEF